jgi:SAM-dependent methyltransferase
VIGDLYEESLAGLCAVEIEHSDGRRAPLRVREWLAPRAGDESLLGRCEGPTLDIGSGPGRLTVALAERGLPSLGIDLTAYAVELTRSAGGLALRRDVFGRVPGSGRWRTVLLADGNIGIGGDPAALLRRTGRLLRPGGRALVEVENARTPTSAEWVRLRSAARTGDWFRWARLSAADAREVAAAGGMRVDEQWRSADRWFVTLST